MAWTALRAGGARAPSARRGPTSRSAWPAGPPDLARRRLPAPSPCRDSIPLVCPWRLARPVGRGAPRPARWPQKHERARKWRKSGRASPLRLHRSTALRLVPRGGGRPLDPLRETPPPERGRGAGGGGAAGGRKPARIPAFPPPGLRRAPTPDAARNSLKMRCGPIRGECRGSVPVLRGPVARKGAPRGKGRGGGS